MSYTAKNNLLDQMNLLNTILPYYGIKSVYDNDTEILSSNINCEPLNEFIPEIQDKFKTSIMNLSRSDYKITQTNAIPILKHMCIQARIPFDITKYPKHYTFAIAPVNCFLKPENKENTIVDENAPISSLNDRKPRSLEYYKNLYTEIHPDKVTFIDAPMGSMLKWTDLKDIIDLRPYTDVFMTLAKTACKRCDYNKVYIYRMAEGCLKLKLDRTCDFLNSVSSIQLLDSNCNVISNENTFRVSIGNKDYNFETGMPIDLPVGNIIYYEMFIKFDYNGEQLPVYCYVNTSESMLSDGIRKRYKLDKWQGMDWFIN